MLEKIQTVIKLNATNKDPKWTEATEFIAYVKQYGIKKSYTSVTAISDTQVSFTIPYTDAKSLTEGNIYVQLFWKDSNSIPNGIEEVTIPISPVIPEEGYNGVSS